MLILESLRSSQDQHDRDALNAYHDRNEAITTVTRVLYENLRNRIDVATKRELRKPIQLLPNFPQALLQRSITPSLARIQEPPSHVAIFSVFWRWSLLLYICISCELEKRDKLHHFTLLKLCRIHSLFPSFALVLLQLQLSISSFQFNFP